MLDIGIADATRVIASTVLARRINVYLLLLRNRCFRHEKIAGLAGWEQLTYDISAMRRNIGEFFFFGFRAEDFQSHCVEQSGPEVC